MLTAMVGTNWGDEGKGRMVDLIAADYDVVVRYQGGNNAGHTVINDQGKFVFNLLPSGILHPNIVNVLGNGMVIDLEHLGQEITELTQQGIAITPDSLKISDKAMISLPYHKRLDVLEEARLKDAKFGSTQRGIAPAYADKYLKKGIRLGDLFFPEALREKVEQLIVWKNLILSAYGETADADIILNWLLDFGEGLKAYICDTGTFLAEAAAAGQNILFEAQLGALRDIDFGIYPYTSSSTTIAAYAPIGSGIPFCSLDQVISVVKAFSSCVGEGPFVTEFFGEAAEQLREAGEEYGAATGRPRRVGPFDVVASRYGAKLQGATYLALTKLDVLAYLDEIPICTAYDIEGMITEEFPLDERLYRARPVYKMMPGFKTDISHCRQMSDLPPEARDYIDYIETVLGVPVKWVSVGPNRDDYILVK